MTKFYRHRLLTPALMLIGIVGLGAIATPAAAQNDALNGVRVELERTDRVLEEAREIVKEALGAAPAQLLREARRLQNEARSLLTDDVRPVRALAKTRLARAQALRAVELAKAQIRLLERVRHLLAENRELVKRTRDAVSASSDPTAARLLEAGVNELSRGQRAFNDRHFRQAVRMSLFGRDLLHRAIRLAEGDVALSRERVRDEINRTDEFLREARVALEDDRDARGAYDEAVRLQARARDHLDERRLEQARRFTLRAREAALNLLRREIGQPTADDVEALIGRVSARFEELNAEARGAEDREVDRLLGQARAHLAKAREALSRQKLRRAFTEAQLASSMLGRADTRLR